MNYSCSSDNHLVVKLLNVYSGEVGEFVRAEILSFLFTAGSLADCFAMVGAQLNFVE